METFNAVNVYVGHDEGGCSDVGVLQLKGFQVVSTKDLQELHAKMLAWKEMAENQYLQVRIAKFNEDPSYPVQGALDAFAKFRYPELFKD